MAVRLERSITRSARLVLDVREWYASTFGAGAGSMTLSNSTPVRLVIRPDALLTVTAEPTVPRDPRWPFPGAVELVMVRTPAGMLAFFGRARSVGSGPLRRLPLAGARCKLRVEAPGYARADLGEVRVPAPYEATKTLRVELMPGIDYPFPAGPTVLRGGVYATDGTGLAGVTVNTAPVAAVKPVTTDDQGQWVLLPYKQTQDGPKPIGPETDLLFEGIGSAGTTIRVPNLKIQAGRISRMPQTVARGVAVRTNGAPVVGAKVEIAPYTGESRTRLDGTWLFYPGLELPLSGRKDVIVKLTAEGRPPVTSAATLELGEANDVPPITV